MTCVTVEPTLQYEAFLYTLRQVIDDKIWTVNGPTGIQVFISLPVSSVFKIVRVKTSLTQPVPSLCFLPQSLPTTLTLGEPQLTGLEKDAHEILVSLHRLLGCGSYSGPYIVVAG